MTDQRWSSAPLHRHARRERAARCLAIGVIAIQLALNTTVAAFGADPVVSRLPKGIDDATRTAIDRGLAYLARTQDRQGFWSNRTGYGEYPVAMTSLAGVALLMEGSTTTQGRYAPNVDRAVNYLLRSATPSGLIGENEMEARPMFGHGFATLFLSQVVGMVEDPARSSQIQQVLGRAVQLTQQSQSRMGGWLYTPDSRGDEGSVTITQVQGLRSCRNMGVAVPKTVIDAAMKYLLDSQNSDGGIRYTAAQQGASRVPISAAAVACWYNAGDYTSPNVKRALAFCKEKIRGDTREPGHDYYTHLYWSQALYVSSDPEWDAYFARRRQFLLAEQQADGSWWGDSVGDVYGTAIALIILQLPYNNVPIMQR